MNPYYRRTLEPPLKIIKSVMNEKRLIWCIIGWYYGSESVTLRSASCPLVFLHHFTFDSQPTCVQGSSDKHSASASSLIITARVMGRKKACRGEGGGAVWRLLSGEVASPRRSVGPEQTQKTHMTAAVILMEDSGTGWPYSVTQTWKGLIICLSSDESNIKNNEE